LDAKLAHRRHFPSINWLESYSLYTGTLGQWYIDNISKDWIYVRTKAMKILQKEDELQEIVQLVGSDALPEKERLTLETARLIREAFLQQNAYHEVDSFCSLKKQAGLLKAIINFGDIAEQAVDEGVTVESVSGVKSKNELVKARFIKEEEFESKLKSISEAIEKEVNGLIGG